MAFWQAPITDLRDQASLVRRYRYGMIQVSQGELVAVRPRLFPKLASPETIWWGIWTHRHRSGDSCWLYYNQPRGFGNFLALKFVFSTARCSFASFRRAIFLLDEIAAIKGSDALLCDASNLRISDRLLHRWGWQQHTSSRRRRNFIKRFYGDYSTAQEKTAQVNTVQVNTVQVNADEMKSNLAFHNLD